ncbi:MAG: 16S rRNA processing protein RimM [Anaerolineales bacterium]|nr:16S rRNA processing protein RimM [Anaerolineales bacterium]
MTGPAGPAQANTGGNSGSSGERRPELRYLAVGRIVRAHGLRGEVSVTLLTDFPERFDTTEWLYLGNEFEATPYRLEKYRWHQDNVLLTLVGVSDRNAAEQLKGLFVQVPIEEAVPLPDGSYYLYQLIGLRVESTEGEVLGTITDVLETGANNVYVVQQENREILLPAIPDVVKKIDITQGIMVVQLIEGLI